MGLWRLQGPQVVGTRFDLSLGVDSIWGIWGSFYNIPKAMFYLFQGDYKGFGFLDLGVICLGCRGWGLGSGIVELTIQG